MEFCQKSSALLVVFSIRDNIYLNKMRRGGHSRRLAIVEGHDDDVDDDEIEEEEEKSTRKRRGRRDCW